MTWECPICNEIVDDTEWDLHIDEHEQEAYQALTGYVPKRKTEIDPDIIYTDPNLDSYESKVTEDYPPTVPDGKKVCPTCNGTGEIDKDIYGTPTGTIYKCERCYGFGLIDDNPTEYSSVNRIDDDLRSRFRGSKTSTESTPEDQINSYIASLDIEVNEDGTLGSKEEQDRDDDADYYDRMRDEEL